MRRFIMAAALIATAGAAFASGYDDYMRGFEAKRAGNTDAALAAFTAALAAGDLAVTYQPDAHLGRGEALIRKGRCAEAIADFDAALGLRPKLIDALIGRARANTCLEHYDAALTDIDEAIAVTPNTFLYAQRGQFNWARGNFSAAANDYLTAVKVQPKRAFNPQAGVESLINYAIAAARAKTFDPAVFTAAQRDLPHEGWPAPLADFFAGKITADQVYAEAANGEERTAPYRKCDADYFIGEWQYANGDPAGKARLLGMEQNCPKNARVLFEARRDLKRIP